MNRLRVPQLLLGGLLMLLGTQAHAQPANDGCAGAQTTTPNGTCYGGTTVAATDGWIGSVGCAGNNPEVWYSFVATGPVADFVVTSGSLGGNVEVVLVSAGGPCTGLVVEGSACGPGPLSTTVSYSLVIGGTYYYTISSTGAAGTFTTCVTTYNPPPSPGFDCFTAEALCTNAPFNQGNFTGIGSVEELSQNSCFGLDERQSKWYTFTCSQSGTFQLLVNPVNYVAATQTGDDYDFALWDVTSGCYVSANILPVPLACNWSGCVGSTGIAPTAPFMAQVAATDYQANNPPGPGDCLSNQQWATAAVTLTACKRYALLVDNYTTSSSGFSVAFSGTAIMGPSALFTYSLSANCQTLTAARGALCTSNAMNYAWNFGDGFNSTLGVPGPHTYAGTGVFTVSLQVSDANGCVDTYSYQVNIGCLPLPVELMDLSAKAVDGAVQLDWHTATELGNDHFTVERSTDNSTYTAAGIVAGAGSTTTQQAYSFIDRPPVEGTLYYRLQQTDLNGTTTTSPAVTVVLHRSLRAVHVEPMPLQGEGRLLVQAGAEGPLEIQVIDLLGRSVAQRTVPVMRGVNAIPISSAGWPAGTYGLRVSLLGEQFGLRLVVQ